MGLGPTPWAGRPAAAAAARPPVVPRAFGCATRAPRLAPAAPQPNKIYAADEEDDEEEDGEKGSGQQQQQR